MSSKWAKLGQAACCITERREGKGQRGGGEMSSGTNSACTGGKKRKEGWKSPGEEGSGCRKAYQRYEQGKGNSRGGRARGERERKARCEGTTMTG